MNFDEKLPRLGNLGQSATIPSGNAAQHPRMKEVSIHYIELAQTASTPLGEGVIIYKGEETMAGGSSAVLFDEALKGRSGDQIYSIPMERVPTGEYQWVRVSLTYQKYDISYRLNIPPFIENQDFDATISSFVGFNTFINQHQVLDSTIVLNENKLQGYWAFETKVNAFGVTEHHLSQGDGAAVTVVNPINSTSPIPQGSCVVTGDFSSPLIIPESAPGNIDVLLNFSINNSFEWKDLIPDGKYEPNAGEQIVDMGLRGLHPEVRY